MFQNMDLLLIFRIFVMKIRNVFARVYVWACALTADSRLVYFEIFDSALEIESALVYSVGHVRP